MWLYMFESQSLVSKKKVVTNDVIIKKVYYIYLSMKHDGKEARTQEIIHFDLGLYPFF
jgi:hypothetical protein